MAAVAFAGGGEAERDVGADPLSDERRAPVGFACGGGGGAESDGGAELLSDCARADGAADAAEAPNCCAVAAPTRPRPQRMPRLWLRTRAKGTIQALQMNAFDDALWTLERDLEAAKRYNARRERRRQEVQAKQRQKEMQEQARISAEARRSAAVLQIQSAYRGHFVRTVVVRNRRWLQDQSELSAYHAKLHSSLSSMRGTLHDLVFLPQDRDQAATTLQSWWRGTLVRRIVRVLRMRLRLLALNDKLEDSAMRLQTAIRGRLARGRLRRLQQQRLDANEEAKRARDQLEIHAAIKLQGAVRGLRARRFVQQKRRDRDRALREQGNDDMDTPKMARRKDSMIKIKKGRRHVEVKFD